MAELLDRVRGELRSRLSELRPAVEEYDRLDAALRALVSGADDGTQSSPSPGTTTRRRRAQTVPTVPRRQRAPRGANRAAVLRAVQERPGASAAELSQASGVGRATLYTLLSRLVRDGGLERQKLPSGHAGYRVAANADVQTG